MPAREVIIIPHPTLRKKAEPVTDFGEETQQLIDDMIITLHEESGAGLAAPAGTWVTLDWEWFGRNDPLFDLVTLHQSLELPRERLAELAAGLLGAPAEEARLRACLRVFWLREYAWAAAEIAAGDQRTEIAAQQELGSRRLAELL